MNNTFLVRMLYSLAYLQKQIQSLIDLPTAVEEKHTLAIRLLSAVGKAAYQLRPELCIAVLVKSVNACLEKGNTPDAAVGFMAFGSIFLGGILGRRRRTGKDAAAHQRGGAVPRWRSLPRTTDSARFVHEAARHTHYPRPRARQARGADVDVRFFQGIRDH